MVITRDEAAAAQNTTERLVDLQEPGTSANGQRPQGAQPRPLMMQPAAETSGFFLLGSEVSRVGLRMPEFTPTDPELWFSIIDRSFHASGITADATKFGYALTTLGPRYTLEVRDIIMNPPAEGAYETLKSELTKRLSLSQEHKTRRLLEHEEIGDRKPSQFLRHLRSLGGNAVGDQVVRTVWLSRLPAHIQPHLVTRTADTLEQLADIAGAIVEATMTPLYQVAEATRSSASQAQPRNDPVSMEAKLELRLAQMRLALQQEMSEQLSAIRRSINEIGENRRACRDRSGDRRRPRSHSRSRSGSRGQSASGICWCH
ncbi:hypothetical protein DMN91_012250 [Ooceraea biroi]|uniref:DUF7041 domain-containing protein n=1 Tax=Ooceraea biroi TaxID=2015173 RepID=A0A3L8D4U3_OOCBI|nr:uncharacterized protein LOC105285397 [Ooceraea biroi]RLU15256.1 hypothetical protein DMN91_012250 [Ooceraea biroi]